MEERLKYEVRQDAGIYTLMVNGRDSMCPHQTVFPTQQGNNQLAFIKQSCCTQCPLASIEHLLEERIAYSISCGQPTTLQATKHIPPKIEMPSGIQIVR
jgi:hypothetical protein